MMQGYVMRDNIIWVTGASSGIGKALSMKLAEQGNFVIISARKLPPLIAMVEQFPNNMAALAVDVSDATSLSVVSQQLSEITDVVDVVIMSAGTVIYEDNLDFDHASYQHVFGVNFFGMLNTIAVVKPFLERAQQKAYIVGVSSLSMMIGFSRAEAYGASKAAADYFLHALSIDLPKRKYDVSIVRPGFVDTPMTSVNDFPMPFLMTPDEAADRIISGMERRRRVIAFPRRLSILLRVMSWFPSFWYRYIGPRTSRNQL